MPRRCCTFCACLIRNNASAMPWRWPRNWRSSSVRCHPWMNTICCWEASNEELNGSSGACQRTSVLQGGAGADDCGELCCVGRGGCQGESQSHPLSGSVVGDGERGAGPARDREPDSRCATA